LVVTQALRTVLEENIEEKVRVEVCVIKLFHVNKGPIFLILIVFLRPSIILFSSTQGVL
jgi:hypothetical protein